LLSETVTGSSSPRKKGPRGRYNDICNPPARIVAPLAMLTSTLSMNGRSGARVTFAGDASGNALMLPGTVILVAVTVAVGNTVVLAGRLDGG
jgi:hypothetical protein